MKRNTTRVWTTAAAAALLIACAPLLRAEPLLKSGDRMVFLGDSITQQMIHTRYVMNYFALHFPRADITFRNAGWGGDTAPGGLDRLQRDVLSLKPAVVSICFGMNDGRYRAFDQDAYDRYMDGMEGLVDRLRDAGAKVVLLTPGCVDPDQHGSRRSAEQVREYNNTLALFAKGVKLLAQRENLPVFDLHALMLDVQRRAKSNDPGFTMIPDSVHPSPPGQALMAYGLLTALGCDGHASGLEIDAASGSAVPDRCGAARLKVSKGAVSFVRTDESLPAWFEPEAEVIFRYCPAIKEMNRYPLKVTGLEEGDWKLTVDGQEVGTFSAADLAKGIDLAGLPGPWRELGEKVNALSAEQEKLYFTRWRQVSLIELPQEAQPEMRALVRKLDEITAQKESERINASARRTWEWSLTAVR